MLVPVAASFLVAAAVGVQSTSQPPSVVLDNGQSVVSIAQSGVVTGARGRLLHPEAMPAVTLPPQVHSWIGVVFTNGSGRVRGVIPGDAVDYGGRQVATPVSFVATADRVVAIHRIDEVEVRVEYWWEPAVDALVSAITLKNVGTGDVTNPIVTTEWQLPGSVGSTWPPEFSAELPPPPSDVHRLGLMPNNLRPGDEQESGFAYRPVATSGRPRIGGAEVPLRLWTNATWPDGVNLGLYLGGISTGDFDQDGWSDLFVAYAGGLYRNVAGQDWEFVDELLDQMGDPGEARYGSAICDYDSDGLPDIGTEPRMWIVWCYDLLKNLDGTSFENVAEDPAIIDVVPCDGDCETLAVADVDGDGDLDSFLPAYPFWVFGGPGNFFLQNLGPIGSNGETTYHEASAEAGLDNPDGVNRPEGAEFHDVDGDGDVDLYSNGTLYRNLSTFGTPLFEPLFGAGTGISFGNTLDEGAHFLDYDMDGDFDLLISFTSPSVGLRLFESHGDGSWLLTAKTIFDAYDISLIFGVSAVDWDNDGDLDVTSMSTFRRNQLIEGTPRHFTVATHDLDPAQIGFGTPAWFDFDHDGDQDCGFGGQGSMWFLENTLYDTTTPSASKRHVRVRVVRDSDAVDRGLETEFGAVVALDVIGAAADGRARVQQVTASAGYLNQGEYVLHFALPPDPDPRTDEDVHFALRVDLKGAAEQGFARVDRHVNPLLGDIDLADLEAAGDREIVIYRSGRVRMAGCDFAPAVAMEPLQTTTGGLAEPGSVTPLPAPIVTPAGSWFVGIEVVTDPLAPPQRVEELLLDGVLAAAVDCSGVVGNVFAWDVTDPGAPQLLPGGLLDRATPSRNFRTALPVDFALAPGRTYRIVARVSKLRTTAIAGPVANGALTTTGGLSYRDLTPCDGVAVASAVVDANVVYAALRFRGEATGVWADLGHGFSASGTPLVLTGSGDLRTDSTVTVAVAGAPASSLWLLVVGLTPLCLAFADGVLVPSVEIVLYGTTDAAGAATYAETWEGGLPGGDSFYVQALVVDPTAPRHFAFTNALSATVPY